MNLNEREGFFFDDAFGLVFAEIIVMSLWVCGIHHRLAVTEMLKRRSEKRKTVSEMIWVFSSDLCAGLCLYRCMLALVIAHLCIRRFYTHFLINQELCTFIHRWFYPKWLTNEENRTRILSYKPQYAANCWTKVIWQKVLYKLSNLNVLSTAFNKTFKLNVLHIKKTLILQSIHLQMCIFKVHMKWKFTLT